jgi:hypothetical protein
LLRGKKLIAIKAIIGNPGYHIHSWKFAPVKNLIVMLFSDENLKYFKKKLELFIDSEQAGSNQVFSPCCLLTRRDNLEHVPMESVRFICN